MSTVAKRQVLASKLWNGWKVSQSCERPDISAGLIVPRGQACNMLRNGHTVMCALKIENRSKGIPPSLTYTSDKHNSRMLNTGPWCWSPWNSVDTSHSFYSCTALSMKQSLESWRTLAEGAQRTPEDFMTFNGTRSVPCWASLTPCVKCRMRPRKHPIPTPTPPVVLHCKVMGSKWDFQDAQWTSWMSEDLNQTLSTPSPIL